MHATLGLRCLPPQLPPQQNENIRTLDHMLHAAHAAQMPKAFFSVASTHWLAQLRQHTCTSHQFVGQHAACIGAGVRMGCSWPGQAALPEPALAAHLQPLLEHLEHGGLLLLPAAGHQIRHQRDPPAAAIS